MHTGDRESSIFFGDLTEFFGDLLKESAVKLEYQRSPYVIDYVAKVLTNFHISQHFFVQPEAKIPILADMLAEALEADIYRRISIYRQLGDTSLMLTAVFKEALERKAVDIKYCYQMGENAYFYLSQIADSQTVYSELSEAFVETSKIIRNAFLELRLAELTIHELLRQYEKQPTRYGLEKLKEKGVVPLPFSRKSNEDLPE